MRFTDSELTLVNKYDVVKRQSEMTFIDYLKWKREATAAAMKYEVHNSSPETYEEIVKLQEMATYRKNAIEWIDKHIKVFEHDSGLK